MSLLTEISRTVVNARTYTGPGGNIFPNTSPVTQTPAYVQRGALTQPPAGTKASVSLVPATKASVSLVPSFSYDGSTMVLFNPLVSGVVQLLVYAQAADKTYTVSTMLELDDVTSATFCTSAISYDGTVCVLGSYKDNTVIVFRKVNGVWARIFTGSGVSLGIWVSISGDGTKIAAGSNDNFGYVNVYTRTGNAVVLQQTLTGQAAGMDTGGDFGIGLSLSGDGQTLAVGAPNTNTDFGAVVTYKLLNNVWSQQSTLVPVGVTSSAPHIGASVTLDQTGVTMAIGCYGAGLQQTPGTGCIVVYTLLDGVWTQGQTIIPYDVQTSPNFSLIGYNVSLSANGQTLTFDGVNDFKQQGGVWIFQREANGLWRAKGNKRVGAGYTLTSGATQQFGGFISPDASVLVVSTVRYNNAGNCAFWIFA